MENEYPSINETLQENTDSLRLLKAGLRCHDPIIVSSAIERISSKYGDIIAGDIASRVITILIEEGWSFQLENGEDSPLI